MSSHCDYCNVYPRNPCTSKKEASRCPNCRDQGMYMDFNARDIAIWIRSNSSWSDEAEALNAAADLIEKKL